MDITIEVRLSPTEDPERVKQAVLNLFPDAIESPGRGNLICMRSRDAGTLFRRIAVQKITDTARSILLRSVHGEAMAFRLNKQAAFSGVVNFSDGGSALGDLAVKISVDAPEAIVNRFLGGRP